MKSILMSITWKMRNLHSERAITLSQAGESLKAIEKKSTDLTKKATGVKLASIVNSENIVM